MAKRKDGLTRAEFLKASAIAAGTGVWGLGFGAPTAGALDAATQGGDLPSSGITVDDLRSFAKVAGLRFTDEQLAKVREGIDENLGLFESLRQDTADYDLLPPTPFRVHGADKVRGGKVQARAKRRSLKRPKNDEDLAFLPLADLAQLVKTRQVSSMDLTELAFARLKRFGPKLVCVAELLEDRALNRAGKADLEIAAGKYRGPLHGIPCGVKDLFSVEGYRTQWGTEAFRARVINTDAAVVERLDQAGAVITAKLSLGALAMDDKWYEGQTKNPWKPEQGSSGSSAGSASSVAAGLLPFALGTETSGSIVSPSHRCRVTGFRPTFGSVSRFGAMALCWTLDKVGVLARTAEDSALVFAALAGPDERDVSTLPRSFDYRELKDLAGLKIGVVGKPLASVQEALKEMGATLAPVNPPTMDPGLWFILFVESAAMFDEITRNGRLDLVKENDWPDYWRAARFVPAVEYAQAERARTKLMRAFEEAFAGVDLVLLPNHGDALIYPMNLVGWPQVLLPMGQDDKGVEVSVSLLAKPFDEARMLAVGQLLQDKFGFHKLRPNMRALS
jgi:Asp-tRNA(Asn)/Glu-tRNA(Gln) amidotransferase A subunit family amidase/Asp-tRNA(Asn)/Glu-tRNA(Gln) amidotransferase C subunit